MITCLKRIRIHITFICGMPGLAGLPAAMGRTCGTGGVAGPTTQRVAAGEARTTRVRDVGLRGDARCANGQSRLAVATFCREDSERDARPDVLAGIARRRNRARGPGAGVCKACKECET